MNVKYFAVHYKDKVTGKKGYNVEQAENVDEATRKVGIFGYQSRFEWTGSEPYKNVE